MNWYLYLNSNSTFLLQASFTHLQTHIFVLFLFFKITHTHTPVDPSGVTQFSIFPKDAWMWGSDLTTSNPLYLVGHSYDTPTDIKS